MTGCQVLALKTTSACHNKKKQNANFYRLTCYLIADQLAGLDLADAAEQAAELLLGHVLGQVVDDEVGLAVVVCGPGLHGRGAAAAVGGRPVGRVASSAGAVCHRGLHVTDDLEQRGEEGVEEEEGGEGARTERSRETVFSGKMAYLAI